ncbi:hypothetical protein KFL_009610040 [Klebsormidium nitens]|uniref:Uncharacterized protein n=1 Tax=Klebsormidium nitens TaxID=105231 RepID=A0A1Y1IRY4_KLENI|nr:hypothetical protein KFL_009610040 [Klebsormidium nitens]|eukprot:GAQ92269.1 hypothetical protein KFL_009610040 [Klebsormidium nitens]
MEALKRGGLWEIETVGKQRSFLARGPVKKDRVCATVAKRPVRAESVVKKTVKVVEIDLDELDDEKGELVRAARTDSKESQCGPIVEVVREGVKVSEEIGEAKESQVTAVESEPADVEQATEKPVVESQELEKHRARVRRDPAEWYQANVGVATEAVGAEEPEHGVEKTSSEKSDAMRYQESEGGESGGVWVTPKAKNTARKRSVTSYKGFE